MRPDLPGCVWRSANFKGSETDRWIRSWLGAARPQGAQSESQQSVSLSRLFGFQENVLPASTRTDKKVLCVPQDVIKSIITASHYISVRDRRRRRGKQHTRRGNMLNHRRGPFITATAAIQPVTRTESEGDGDAGLSALVTAPPRRCPRLIRPRSLPRQKPSLSAGRTRHRWNRTGGSAPVRLPTVRRL